MRILMMGTGAFAVPTFRWLLESEHDVPALVTRPDAGRRDRRWQPVNPMREVALAQGLTVHEPPSVNRPEALAWLRDVAAELLVVCDYGQILSKDALATAALGGVNLHGSLLPKYRGAAPVNWAVYHDERQTGVTAIHMTPRLDGGPCLAQRATDIGPDETASELEQRLARMGVEVVAESIARLEGWDRRGPLGTVQDPAEVTQAPRLQKADGLIDWSRTARQIYCQVRAMKPWPGTYTHLSRGSKPAMRLLVEWAEPADIESKGLAPGEVLPNPDTDLRVATGDGVLRLVRLQPEGKRPMGSADFVRGYQIRPGTKLGQ